MRVEEAALRRMFRAIGMSVSADVPVARLQKKVNLLTKVLGDVKDTPEGEELTLFRAVCSALEEGDRIEVIPLDSEEGEEEEQDKDSEEAEGDEGAIPPEDEELDEVQSDQEDTEEAEEEPESEDEEEMAKSAVADVEVEDEPKTKKPKKSKAEVPKAKKVKKDEEAPQKATKAKGNGKTTKAKGKKEEDEPKTKKPKGTRATKDGKPGVIVSIVEFLKKASQRKPLSKKQLVEKLAGRFEDKVPESMAKTVNAQIGYHLKAFKGIDVETDGEGGYWIESDE